MKVILTGITGFIGEEVLRQCIAHPQITEIFALARRELKDEYMQVEKVTFIKVEDFGAYSEDVIEKIKGADACVWAIGTLPQKGLPEKELLRKINIDWVLHSADTYSSKWILPEGRKFMFICTSGFLVPDPETPNQKLWFLEELRKMRTETDRGILALAEEGKITGIVAKPGGVTDGEPLYARLTMGQFTISKQALAATYIDMILHGHESGLVRNAYLKKRGGEILAEQKLASKKESAPRICSR